MYSALSSGFIELLRFIEVSSERLATQGVVQMLSHWLVAQISHLDARLQQEVQSQTSRAHGKNAWFLACK